MWSPTPQRRAAAARVELRLQLAPGALRALSLQWVPPNDAARRRFGVLEKHGTLHQYTYPGRVWVLTDEVLQRDVWRYEATREPVQALTITVEQRREKQQGIYLNEQTLAKYGRPTAAGNLPATKNESDSPSVSSSEDLFGGPASRGGSSGNRSGDSVEDHVERKRRKKKKKKRKKWEEQVARRRDRKRKGLAPPYPPSIDVSCPSSAMSYIVRTWTNSPITTNSPIHSSPRRTAPRPSDQQGAARGPATRRGTH